jgi:hypothetical protein
MSLFALAGFPAALAQSPYLHFEAIGAWGVGNSPTRVPATDPVTLEDTDAALPVRVGLGYAQGDLFVQVRKEWLEGASPAYDPRTYDVRIGTIDNSKGGLWGSHEAFHDYQQVIAPFVGYRGVTDMLTDAQSFSLIDGGTLPVSDGHGLQAGVYFGQPDVGMWAEFAAVYYVVAWPSEDRPRYGLLARGGVSLGPVLAGVRLDVDPGTGPYAAIELGFGGFVSANPRDWTGG